jgi:hypothetical protein
VVLKRRRNKGLASFHGSIGMVSRLASLKGTYRVDRSARRTSAIGILCTMKGAIASDFLTCENDLRGELEVPRLPVIAYTILLFAARQVNSLDT